MFASSREVGRIPLVAVLGAAGSGKTTFLNRLLALPSMEHSVVLSASTSNASALLAHARVYTLPEIEQVSDSGCLCCGMNSAMGDTLRDIFLRALSKRIARVDRVVIESRALDASPLRQTVRHAPFLGQRYVYQATLTMIDAQRLQTRVLDDAQVSLLQQSDCAVLSRADLISAKALGAVTDQIRAQCPELKIIRSDVALEDLVPDTLH